MSSQCSITILQLIKKYKINTNIFNFRYADDVLYGDEVLVQRNDELIPAYITKLSTFLMQGNHLTHIIQDLGYDLGCELLSQPCNNFHKILVMEPIVHGSQCTAEAKEVSKEVVSDISKFLH